MTAQHDQIPEAALAWTEAGKQVALATGVGGGPGAGLGAEFDEQLASAVQLRSADPTALQRLAVQQHRLHVLHGAAVHGLDEVLRANPETLVTDSDGRRREQRSTHEKDVLAGDGKQAERRPHVPRAEPA